MSRERSISPRRIRRTFVAESIRAFAAGIVETALITFAVLIAVTRFQSGAAVKSLLLASPALGLLGSFLVVALALRSRFSTSATAGLVSLVGMAAFALAAWQHESELCFVVGVTLGIGALGMVLPLQTHYLRLNYPATRRGRLFSVSIVIRASTAIVASWVFGWLLGKDFGLYPVLLWTLAGAALVSALCQFAVPSKALRRRGGRAPGFASVARSSLRDRLFVQLLVAAMVLGVGVLAANALRVDYLANPEHGVALDVKTVAWITGILPAAMRLVTTFFWGWLFDRVDFIWIRVFVNLLFLAAILLFFLGDGLLWIALGSALFGLARGGGEILFNLFVTKLAPSAEVADYMSVHTFLAGTRTLAAPFVGFYLVQWAGIPGLVAVCSTLVFASVFLVRGAAGEGRERF